MNTSTPTPRQRAIDTLEELRPRLYRLGADNVRAWYPIGLAPVMTAECPGGVRVEVSWHEGEAAPWAVRRTVGESAVSERTFGALWEALEWLGRELGEGS